MAVMLTTQNNFGFMVPDIFTRIKATAFICKQCAKGAIRKCEDCKQSQCFESCPNNVCGKHKGEERLCRDCVRKTLQKMMEASAISLENFQTTHDVVVLAAAHHTAVANYASNYATAHHTTSTPAVANRKLSNKNWYGCTTSGGA